MVAVRNFRLGLRRNKRNYSRKQRISGHTCKERRQYIFNKNKLLPLLLNLCLLGRVLVNKAQRENNAINLLKYQKFKKFNILVTSLTLIW